MSANPGAELGANKHVTVGVFDSGFGGLTVLRAMLPLLGDARCLYLGDTARLPYGSKSRETVIRYAVSATEFLQQQGAEFLVIACNTATALALDEIRAVSSVPVLGVVETGAAAAAKASVQRSVLVLGTSATIASHAYLRACNQAQLRATEMACPLLVPLVEEGWIEHPVTDQVVKIYVEEAMRAASAEGAEPDTVLLGCTHYPLLRHVFARHLPPGMNIVDCADATAEQAIRMMARESGNIANIGNSTKISEPELVFYVTDSPQQFRSLGSRFLGQPIHSVSHVNLPE